MKERIAISKIMTPNVITLNLSNTLEEAEAIFKKYRIRHIPVVSGTNVIGMLSYTDLMRISFADAIGEDEYEVDTVVYNMFTIEQVMVKNVTSVSSAATVKDVAEIFSKEEFHALPVVDNNQLVGIVTTTDLINYLLEQL